MKETDMLSGFTAPKYASELTDEAKSTYAKSRISNSPMPNPDTNFDPIDTPLGGGRISRSVEEEIQEGIRTWEESLGPMTDEQKEVFKATVLASRNNPAGTPPADQEGDNRQARLRAQERIRHDTQTLPEAQVDEGTPGELSAMDRFVRNQEQLFKVPENLNQVFENIMQRFPEYSKDGPFALIKKEQTENGEVERLQGGNFIRWMRHRMLDVLSINGEDAEINYQAEVEIRYGKGQGAVSLKSMLENKEIFFYDKDGVYHKELWEQAQREVFAFTVNRRRDVQYRKTGGGMGDDKNLPGQMKTMFSDNNFTKTLWGGKSLWYWTMDLPTDLQTQLNENGTQFERDHEGTSSLVGRSVATALMVYYHLSDYTKLQEMLGEDSSFFRKKTFEAMREKLAKAFIKENYPKEVKQLAEEFMSNSVRDSIFNEEGTVKDKTAFIKFINFFPTAQVDVRQKSLIRAVLKDALKNKYDLTYKDKNGEDHDDVESINYAETIAHSMTRWTGIGARNDLGAVAYDAQSKILRSLNYRLKQPTDARGGAFGNEYNVSQFKAFGVNYLDSIAVVADENGYEYTLREVMERLATVGVRKQGTRADNDPAYEEDLELERKESQHWLSKLAFKDLTEQNYVSNGVSRWFQEYESFIEGKELHLDKIVEYAMLRGYVYEPDKFGSLIQEGFLKPLRYGYSTWDTHYEKMVRDGVNYDPDNPAHQGLPIVEIGKDKEKFVFVDTPLAKAMYGTQMLDIDKFWKNVPVLDKAGNVMKDQSGNEIYQKIEHVIDPNTIHNNRAQLFKQMALTRIAADIYSHRFLGSPHPRWDANTVEALIAALERIPGELKVDENDIKNTYMPNNKFFTKVDIQYLRNVAGVSQESMLVKEGGWELTKGTARFGKKLLGSFLKALK